MDDDAFNLLALEMSLKKLSLTCEKAFNGKEAVEIVKKKKNFKMIFMDYQMPIMDGIEAARNIT